MIGEVLAGRYKIVEKIGEGGMALVYRARDQLLSRSVAIKILKPQFTGDEDFVRRFRREAQAAAGLSHPNIVNIFDVGQAGGNYYIVMEYVEGRNLKEIIKESGRLPVDQSIDIAIQIAKGLQHAHRHDLIHRDIKPHNILVTPEGQVKVTDFGIARAVASASATQTGVVLGTVHYFSPEQARGEGLGVQSDLYSLGVVLYEMLTGKVPFEGESPISIALKHLDHLPPSVMEINPKVPPDLARVVEKAMAKSLGDRYASADELLADLSKVASLAEGAISPSKAPSEGTKRVIMLPYGREVGEEETRTYESLVDHHSNSNGGQHHKSGTARAEQAAANAHTKEHGADGKTSRTLAVRRGFLVLAGFLVFFAAAWLGMHLLYEVVFPDDVEVPDVEGLPLQDAEKKLEEVNLRPEVVSRVHSKSTEAGQIVAQNPRPGRTVKEGRTVRLTVSLGPEVASVPDVLNLPIREAQLVIEEAGLVVGALSYAARDDVAVGTVIGQEPAAGTRRPEGSEVHLVVANEVGAEPVLQMPDFRGQHIDVVKQKLTDQGLQLGDVFPTSDDRPQGVVVGQDPAPGATIRLGDRVDLVISKGPGAVDATPSEATPGVARPRGEDRLPAELTPQAPVEDEQFAPTKDGHPLVKAKLSIPVPEGKEQRLVQIYVFEQVEPFQREVYKKWHRGGTEFATVVSGYGDPLLVRVYIDGKFMEEKEIWSWQVHSDQD